MRWCRLSFVKKTREALKASHFCFPLEATVSRFSTPSGTRYAHAVVLFLLGAWVTAVAKRAPTYARRHRVLARNRSEPEWPREFKVQKREQAAGRRASVRACRKRVRPNSLSPRNAPPTLGHPHAHVPYQLNIFKRLTRFVFVLVITFEQLFSFILRLFSF